MNIVSKNIIIFRLLSIFTISFLVIDLLTLIDGMNFYFLVLIWVISIFLPEYLAIRDFRKNNNRSLRKTEKRIISFFSALIKLMYLSLLDLTLNSKNLLPDMVMKSSQIFVLILFWVSSFLTLWLIEYVIYHVCDNLSGALDKKSQDSLT